MAGEFIPRTRVLQVFCDLQKLYPGLSPEATANKAANMIGHDAETILRVVNEELAETEGGSQD